MAEMISYELQYLSGNHDQFYNSYISLSDPYSLNCWEDIPDW